MCVCESACMYSLFECNIENLVCEREVSYFLLKSSFVRAKLLIFSRNLSCYKRSLQFGAVGMILGSILVSHWRQK